MKATALNIALGVLLVVILLAAAWSFDPFGRRHHAEQKAADSTATAEVAQVTTRTVDHLATQTIVIRDKADAGAQSIQQAQGADAALPPDVLSAWRAGIDGLRDDHAAPAR